MNIACAFLQYQKIRKTNPLTLRFDGSSMQLCVSIFLLAQESYKTKSRSLLRLFHFLIY